MNMSKKNEEIDELIADIILQLDRISSDSMVRRCPDLKKLLEMMSNDYTKLYK